MSVLSDLLRAFMSGPSSPATTQGRGAQMSANPGPMGAGDVAHPDVYGPPFLTPTDPSARTAGSLSAAQEMRSRQVPSGIDEGMYRDPYVPSHPNQPNPELLFMEMLEDDRLRAEIRAAMEAEARQGSAGADLWSRREPWGRRR